MSNRFLCRTLFAVFFMVLATAACERKDEVDGSDSAMAANDGLLKYVPADTPYVFAMLEPLPDDVLDKFEPKIDAILESYGKLLHVLVGLPEATDKSGGEKGLSEETVALLREFAALLSVEGLASVGMTRDSTIVLYGAGLLPVLRVTLTDGELFDATMSRLEETAGAPLPRATVGGHSYRYAGDAEANLVVAVIGDELVLSLVPTGLSEDLMKRVLGLKLPPTSIADSGELLRIVADNGFLHNWAGLISVERIVATFIDDQTGINAELLSLMNHQGGELSEVCKAEIREMGGIMPRVFTGYSEISVDRISSNTVLELRDDIAAGIATLTAPVPGLGSEQGGLFSFGMSFDLLAARDFYAARLDAMEADPYECELFADLQQGVAQGREALNQPLPPIIYGFKGFLAVVEDIQGLDLASKQPPTSADLRLLLATDNAEGLLAMGALISPEIANLNLQPDGKPVRFESQQLAGLADTTYVAMNENALAISVGAGTEARLGGMLTAPVMEPHPSMSMEMDASRYYAFIADAMALDDADEEPVPEELAAAMRELVAVAGAMVARIAVRVELTGRGVELPSTVELSD